jgi:hypothetical protein
MEPSVAAENKNQILKVDEIVEFFNKLGYKIDKTIIENAEPDPIVEIYSSILEKLNVIKKENLKISFEGMSTFAYPGLHDRPIYILKLFNKMRPFITDILGIENFTTNDLFTPNPKRTKRILSSIIRFYKYKTVEKETYNTLKENLENSISVLKENNAKYEKSLSEYQLLKQTKENEKPEVDKCMEEMNKLHFEKIELDEKSKEIQSGINSVNSLIDENEERIKNIDIINESNNSKIISLRGQIVHSPEKMMIILEDMKNNIEIMNAHISENEINYKNAERHSKNLEIILKYVSELESYYLELDKNLNKLLHANKLIYEETEIKNRKEKTLTEMNSKIDNAIKSISALTSYSEEFHLKQKKIVELKDESLISAKEKLAQITKRINEIIELIGQQINFNKSYEEKISDIDKVKIGYYAHIENEMNGLLNMVQDYSFKFGKMLENKLNINKA